MHYLMCYLIRKQLLLPYGPDKSETLVVADLIELERVDDFLLVGGGCFAAAAPSVNDDLAAKDARTLPHLFPVACDVEEDVLSSAWLITL